MPVIKAIVALDMLGINSAIPMLIPLINNNKKCLVHFIAIGYTQLRYEINRK
jgi:hypothetical protein